MKVGGPNFKAYNLETNIVSRIPSRTMLLMLIVISVNFFNIQNGYCNLFKTNEELKRLGDFVNKNSETKAHGVENPIPIGIADQKKCNNFDSSSNIDECGSSTDSCAEKYLDDHSQCDFPKPNEDCTEDKPDYWTRAFKIAKHDDDILEHFTVSSSSKTKYGKEHRRKSCKFHIIIPPLQEIPKLEGITDFHRDDMIIEHLVREYNVGHIVMVLKSRHHKINVYLQYAHPDSITWLNPTKGDYQREYFDYGQYLHGTNNLTLLLEETRNMHKGPFLVILMDYDYHQDELLTLLKNSVKFIEDTDILFILSEYDTLKTIFSKHNVCSDKALNMYAVKNGLIFRSLTFIRTPLSIPNPPIIEEGKCYNKEIDLKIDLILMTRNRPMQTLAFLQSFSEMQKGLNKIRIIYRADDENFEQAYQFVKECVGPPLDIELVSDKLLGFGKTLLNVVSSSDADYVILGVDEMIWLRPFDLKVAACLLNSSDNIATFQFRLGKSLHFNPIQDQDKRFHKLKNFNDILLYYPLRLRYDFGYVLNVDGTMLSTKDLLYDVKDWITQMKHPGEMENKWIFKRLSTRVRQWHLMNSESHLVNNALTTDGRVIGTSSPKDGSYILMKLLMDDKLQIDYNDFIEDNICPKRTHISTDVEFEALKCQKP